MLEEFVGQLFDRLFGPEGLAAGAILLVIVLGVLHIRDDREWKRLVNTLAPKIDGLATSVEKLTGAVDAMDERRERTITDAIERIVTAVRPGRRT